MTDQELTGALSEALEASAAPMAQPVTTEAAEVQSTGAALRRAREAHGHSIADVVQVIRFSSRQIEALERDDYGALPGATVARGLVRNYAKFLKLDPAPLLAQLDPAVPVPEADVRPPANIGEAEQATLGERISLRMVGIGVAVLGFALVAAWFASQTDLGESRPAHTEAVVTAPPVATAALPAAPVAVATDGPVVPVGAAAGAPPPAVDGLRVEFDDRSWIEIRDGSQRVVFSGEYPAGTRQSVDGKPPFQVWIGKASGVRVFLGERAIDLKPHTREEIARFTLE